MHELYELKEMLCDFLAEHAEKGKIESKGDLEEIYYAAEAAKDLMKILDHEDDGGSYRMGGGSYGSSYGDGQSYAGGDGRGRGRNARRDSMGRYSRDGDYSNERGYSRDSGDMVSQLEKMMNEAPNDQIRQEFRNMINKVRQSN